MQISSVEADVFKNANTPGKMIVINILKLMHPAGSGLKVPPRGSNGLLVRLVVFVRI